MRSSERFAIICGATAIVLFAGVGCSESDDFAAREPAPQTRAVDNNVYIHDYDGHFNYTHY